MKTKETIYIIMLLIFLTVKRGDTFTSLSDTDLKKVDAASGITIEYGDYNNITISMNRIYYMDADGFVIDSGNIFGWGDEYYDAPGYLVFDGNMSITYNIEGDSAENPSRLTLDIATPGPGGYTPPSGVTTIPENVTFMRIGLPVMNFSYQLGENAANPVDIVLTNNISASFQPSQKLGSFLMNNGDFRIRPGSSLILYAQP